MATKAEKKVLPAYISYRSFTNLLATFKENTLPSRIDRSVFGNVSGSYSSSMLASLKFLGLITDDGSPTSLLSDLVEADADARGPTLRKIVEARYQFLTEGLNLERASTGQVVEKFKALGADGSTVSKSIAFFLALAKDAGVKVSSHLRAPAPPSRATTRRSAPKAVRRSSEPDEEVEDDDEELVDSEVERFEIPVPGKRSAVVLIPRDLDEGDWSMLTLMLDAYVKRLRERIKKEEEGGAA